MALLFQPKAEEDLELIYSYSELSWGIEQAEKYIDRLYSSMVELLKYPQLGSKYVTETQSYRKIVVDKHIIYYRITEKHIIVVRILHSKMNRENLL